MSVEKKFPYKKLNPARFLIPKSEFSFSSTRSGGPGGQNVNKVETRVRVTWDFENSMALTDEQKTLIRIKLKSKLNKSGRLSVSSSESRSQVQNKKQAIHILTQLVEGALALPKERRATSVPAASNEARLREKKIHARKKKIRSEASFEPEGSL